MPRHPDTSPDVQAVRASAFSTLAHRLAAYDGERFAFHVGDTWMQAPEGCRMEDLAESRWPRLNCYAPPRGTPELLEAVAARVAARSGLATGADQVLIAAGATGGLDAVCGAILDPGDEVLVLAPFWPLIEGIVRSNRGRPVAVPVSDTIDDPRAIVEVLEDRRSERTVALYVSTPNNPTGRRIERASLEALATWATTHGLWVLSDEVYEDYDYDDAHAAFRPLAPERTFSVHSFSKAFGMAGYRCGYVVGPREVMPMLTRVSTHAFYSTPTPSQAAACVVLDGRGEGWIAGARAQYADTGRSAAARLGVDPPQGSTFLWLDVGSHLDDRGLGGFLEDCADRGLCLAPGTSFGPYPSHVRLCYTAQPPDAVLRGVERLARILERR